jgi:crotonobetainyl-CoA:carnitine CoA-transferase CaiB-like acyl-CoA transferase
MAVREAAAAARASIAAVPRPLAGVRVVDYTAYASGPYCTLMLALLGAEVIRVESSTRLDLNRRPHPVYGRLDVPPFDHLSGHKKSITLNLKVPRAAELARELMAVSDIVIENYRPGVMDRLGLGWETVHARNPRTVMVSISAYGQRGPDSRRPGYAPIFAAEGGLGSLIGYPDGPPAEVRNQMDHQAGLVAAYVAVSLLEARELTGVGRHGDVAARDVAAMLIGESIVEARATGSARRIGNEHELHCPHGVYPAAGEDRWVAIVVRSDTEWARLVALIGDPALESHELGTADGRRERREELEARLAAWTSGQDAPALAGRLQEAGVCAEVSMTARDIVEDEHLWARGGLVRLEHPEHGERPTVQAPWRFEGADVGYTTWSPPLGEHNEEVICDLLGHDRTELRAWIEEGAVH